MLRAGTRSDISVESGEWLILDIGFSKKSASCGLMVNDDDPLNLCFSEAVASICSYIAASSRTVNLLIEAPLSVTFDIAGNPTGRSVDRQGRRTRYWYVGVGCTVMVATLYLLRAIAEISGNVDVRLFEGFVSFKKAGGRSSHRRDVLLLREVVENPIAYSDCIFVADELKMDPSDSLKSAFLVAGIDAGVPPVILRNG